MTHVIVHAGFHKTGTTSLQGFFDQNRTVLQPHLIYYGKSDVIQAGAYARRFGERPFYWRRLRFRRSLRRFLNSVPEAPVVVLSREAFAGAMPGHRDLLGRQIKGYTHASIPLAKEIAKELYRRFGATTQIQFVYTCRQNEPWLRSVYGHLLRSIRLTDDFKEFCARFDPLPDLGHEADDIAAALHPIPVHTVWLEDTGDLAEGPAAAILDLVGVPDEVRAKLLPATRTNAGQSEEKQNQFLMLNRAKHSRTDLKSMKTRILRESSTP